MGEIIFVYITFSFFPSLNFTLIIFVKKVKKCKAWLLLKTEGVIPVSYDTSTLYETGRRSLLLSSKTECTMVTTFVVLWHKPPKYSSFWRGRLSVL